jgi:hypothetical protein
MLDEYTQNARKTTIINASLAVLGFIAAATDAQPAVGQPSTRVVPTAFSYLYGSRGLEGFQR